MAHQFADSGSVGLVTIDLFATKVAEALPKSSIRTVVVVSIADLLPPLKRAVVWAVQKYVKKMIPPVTFAHVGFRRALAEGATRMSAGADPQVYAKPLTHDTLAALQYPGGRRGWPRARCSRTGTCWPTSSSVSRCGNRGCALARR